MAETQASGGGEAGRVVLVAGGSEGAGDRGRAAVGARESSQSPGGESGPQPPPPSVVARVRRQAAVPLRRGRLRGGRGSRRGGTAAGPARGRAGIRGRASRRSRSRRARRIQRLRCGVPVPLDLAALVPFGGAGAEHRQEPVAPLRIAEVDGHRAGMAVEEFGEHVGGVHGLGRDEDRPPGGDGVQGDRGERVALAAAGGAGDDRDRCGPRLGHGGGLFAAERQRAARRPGIGLGLLIRSGRTSPRTRWPRRPAVRPTRAGLSRTRTG